MSTVKTLNNNLSLRSGCSYNPAFGENLFNHVCRLNIKSLIELVWEIAEKVFTKEAKDYFFIRNMFNENHKHAFDFAFNLPTESVVSLAITGFLLYDSDRFKSIEELRSSTKKNDKSVGWWYKTRIDIFSDENFHCTSIYTLIEIAKNLGLSQDEKIQLIQFQVMKEKYPNFFKQMILYMLNVLLKIKNDLVSCDHPVFSELISKKLNNFIMGELVNDAALTDFISVIFEFLKKNSSSEEYEENLKLFFSKCYDTYSKTLYEFTFLDSNVVPEKNAKILLSILESTFSENELNDYFSTYNFFEHCVGNKYNPENLIKVISLYCNILSGPQFKLFMLNKSLNGNSILCNLIFLDEDVAVHTLNLITKKFIRTEEVFEIFNESFLFSMSAKIFERIDLVLKFYKENFPKILLKNNLNKNEVKKALILTNPNDFKKIINFFEFIYDYDLKKYDDIDW